MPTLNGGVVNFSTDDACRVVGVGVRTIAKRPTMIYDLLAFIPSCSEQKIREVMRRLSDGPERKFDGCNCGCRGDWDLRDSLDIELDRLFPP